ncbi:bifunctional metallophosphatase/5'-nucleotidase [Microbacterium sp. HD4P20]|uniref:choice-of-anchor I family protein n=1 Tax=Microbacterium sp. HD4P20 TaxID=2864874 RepID=UPI001C641400|nr:choice-of-anchor I family protein [Microbacterium sp. HD4P20]MCP2635807.1 bifunctional metallophosphatase/5'-nucleotidase [Microbacterium sp. HD4P20]
MPSHAHRRLVAAATTTAAVCALALTPFTAASAAVVPDPIVHSAEDATLSLSPLGTFETGAFDESAAEIVAAHGDRLFVVNALAGSVDVLDYRDPAAITKDFTLSSTGVANSVAVRADGLGVVAFEAAVKTDAGHLVFFDANAADAASAVLGTVAVGSLPDMVTISGDGAVAVVANEGEPADDFSIDPEGSVSVVTLPQTVAAPAQDAVRTAAFHAFDDGSKTLPADVRVFGPTPHGEDRPISRNLEPEYVTIDGGVAYASLQEANAVAVVDLDSATVTDVWSLGFKGHGLAQNALDPSDKDGGFSLRTFEALKGIYMPDAISSYTAGGQTYLVTANEGDAREWGEYEEPARVKNLAEEGFGPVCEPLTGLLGDADLGRLNVTKENGFDADAGCYSELYAFGGRSFSIWTTEGEQVFDSGSSFEEVTAAASPEFFNSNHSESNLEGRSDDKGPEAESVAIGTLSDRTYAFLGFERVGGIAVYDITEPAASTFVTYVNNRDFSVSVEDAADPAAVLSQAGDLGPEGIAFIPAEDSATGEPLLAVGNEVSGTTTLFAIEDLLAPETTDLQVLTINDFHGRIEANFGNGEAGAAVLAGAVDAFEAENPNTLFVSSGDNIGASTFTSFIQEDAPTIEALVAAGLDLGAAGNHEFDRGFADLTGRVTDLYGSADFNLGANVYAEGTTDPVLPEYTVRELDGVRVAFIGTVTPDTATMVTPTGIEGIEFGDQLEAANRVATEITDTDAADVIVLLTHDGSATEDCATIATGDTDYAQLVNGASAEIDAIVSAHTHQAYTCMVPVEGVEGTERPVIQAHQYGTTLGKLDISVDTETRELISIDASLVPLVGGEDGETPLYPADPAVQSIVDEAAAEADVLGAVEVGEISGDILRGGTPPGDDRGVESSLGNLVADVYLWATSNEDYAGTPAQIGIMNPGGLRDDLLYGQDGVVTYRDVAEVQPFANTLVTVTLDGAQLEQLLEEQWQPAGSSRPKLHLGISEGFTYEYDPDAAAGSRIVSMSLNGEAVTADETFTVVTNSFLAAGGDNFATFAEGGDRTDTGQVDLTASVQYFEQAGVVDPAPLGRAVVVDGGPTPTPTPTPGVDWATVDVGSGRVEQGGSLPVKVSGLEPGQQISATLFSEPIVVQGIPAADASGNVSFTVRIPSDLPLGAHTLVIESAGFEPLSVSVTVVAPGQLAVTGAQLPWGIALAAALLVVLGGAIVVMRRRPAVRG